MGASLTTERLRLEPWNAAHTDLLARLGALPDVVRFVGDGTVWNRARAVESSSRATTHWATYGWGWRAIVERDGGAQVGLAALNRLQTPVLDAGADAVEIGWWVDPGHWRRGYASEAGLAIRDEALDRLGAPEVVARIQHENTGSLAVAARLGLEPVGDAVGRFGEPFVLLRGPAR